MFETAYLRTPANRLGREHKEFGIRIEGAAVSGVQRRSFPNFAENNESVIAAI